MISSFREDFFTRNFAKMKPSRKFPNLQYLCISSNQPVHSEYVYYGWHNGIIYKACYVAENIKPCMPAFTLDESFRCRVEFHSDLISTFCSQTVAEPDQTPRSEAPDLVMRCLSMSHKVDVWLI